MMKFTVILFSLFLVSCATTSQKNSIVTNAIEEERVQAHLVEADLENCEGCILGSSHHGTFTSPLRIYELPAPKELNLTNTHFDIPVEWNSHVRKWVNYFTGRGRELFTRYSNRAGRYAPVLSKILAENGLPRDLIYLAMAESGFHNSARSWAKAVGPWQFMPYTGKRFGLNIDWYVDERRDPMKASQAASDYLKHLYDLFGSWELAMAGYNAGEGKMRRAIRRYGTRNFWKIIRGRYLRRETKNYVPKIMALAIIGKNLKAFGFDESVEFHDALDYEEITVPALSDLYEVASVLGLEFEELKNFNPEILRWQTPADRDDYQLRVPIGLAKTWNDVVEKSIVQTSDYKVYLTRGSSRLVHVARKFKVPLKLLRTINPEHVGKRMSRKTEVKLPFKSIHTKKHALYADLYEKPRRSIRARRSYRRVIKRYARSGKMIKNPSVYYTVKKGDTLWDIAKKNGVSLGTLIKSNARIVKRRQVMPGDKLAIR